MAVPSLHVLSFISELRRKGLGFRSIARVLCEKLRVCVSYSTIKRWFSKYGKFLGALTPATSADIKLQLEPVNTELLGVNEKQWGRLGRTEKLVLAVILSEPSMTWSASMVYSVLKKRGFRGSRAAVYQAMKRLVRRGILARIPRWVRGKEFRYEIVKGEVIKGGFRLAGLEPSSFAVHNLRIPNAQVVAEDTSVNLASALFVGSVIYGEAPITQYELNSDYPLHDDVISYLRDRLGWGMTVIYPKPELGVLRVEHRFWPKDLLLSLSSKEEIERRGRLVTELVHKLVSYELERLLSCRRGVLVSATSAITL